MSHNSNTARFARRSDRIIVIVDGKITETGNYKTLIKNKGNFAKLMAEFNASQNKQSKNLAVPKLGR